MSYARFGDDSDVYLIGTYRKGVKVVECCGCKLNTDTRPMTADEEKEFGVDLCAAARESGAVLQVRVNPDPAYAIAIAMADHLDEHRAAGHKVPEEAYDRILTDDEWLEGVQGYE